MCLECLTNYFCCNAEYNNYAILFFQIAFHPKFSSSRVEKERRAILSELQMMNTIEYRVDCQASELLTPSYGPLFYQYGTLRKDILITPENSC